MERTRGWWILDHGTREAAVVTSDPTPDGPTGLQWDGAYGFVTVTAYGQPYGPDGLNEEGLYVGVYYFPGYCSLSPYDPADAARTASVGDFMQWLLSPCSTVEQARPEPPLWWRSSTAGT